VFAEISAECLSGVGIAMDPAQSVRLELPGELPHRVTWIKWRFSGLRHQEVQHRALDRGVAMGNGEDGVIGAATRHIHEGGIVSAGLRIEVLPAGDDRRHDRIGAVCRIRSTGQVQMQPPKLVCRKPSALLVEVSIVAPACDARVWPLARELPLRKPGPS
jgi:hypothetical protein